MSAFLLRNRFEKEFYSLLMLLGNRFEQDVYGLLMLLGVENLGSPHKLVWQFFAIVSGTEPLKRAPIRILQNKSVRVSNLFGVP